MKLSIVIPAFREEATIATVLERVAGVDLQALGVEKEIIVCDDGSTDKTAQEVERMTQRFPFIHLVQHAKNQGKGAAVRAGVLAARGDVVVFLDADLAVDVGHVDRVLGPLRNGVDVAVGCRHVPGASVTQPQGVLRRTLGRGYLRLARALLRIPVADVTCGFKGFKRRVAVDLFGAARCRRWGFDAEVLHLAAKAGYEVAEVPVTWRDAPDSRVRLRRDVLRSLRELLAVRWRSSTRRYDVKGPPARPRASGS